MACVVIFLLFKLDTYQSITISIQFHVLIMFVNLLKPLRLRRPKDAFVIVDLKDLLMMFMCLAALLKVLTMEPESPIIYQKVDASVTFHSQVSLCSFQTQAPLNYESSVESAISRSILPAATLAGLR